MPQTGYVANDNNETTKMGSKGSGLFGISGFGNNASEKNPQNTAMQSVNQSVSGNKMSRSMVPSASTSSNNPKVPASGAGIRMPATDNVAPNSLMLWKKVQHYVVVGGAFVQAGQQASSSGGNNQTNIQQQQQQHPVNNMVPTANQSSLHQ